MSLSLLYVVALLLTVSALGLVHYVLRGNVRRRPADAFQWAAIGLAGLVVLFSLFMAAMVGFVQQRGGVEGLSLEKADVLSSEMNREVEDFSFHLVSTDEATRLSDLRGSVVLVNIWATWCPPCRVELPELNRLQADYRDAGLVVLNLSDEAREDLLTYQDELPLQTMSAIVQPADVPEPLRRNFQVRPTSFVIDRAGVLRSSALGIRSYSQFLSMIEPYLGAPSRRV